MIFSRGAVLDGRVDGASAASKRGIRVRRFAKTCARARGAQAGAKTGFANLRQKLLRVSSVLVGKGDIQRAETFLLSIPWPQWSPQKASAAINLFLETLDFELGGGAGSRTPRLGACFFFDVVAPASRE